MFVPSSKKHVDNEEAERRGRKIDSLKRHLDFIATIRDRQLFWGNETNDSELAGIHLAIGRSLEQTRQQYLQLLERCLKSAR